MQANRMQNLEARKAIYTPIGIGSIKTEIKQNICELIQRILMGRSFEK